MARQSRRQRREDEDMAKGLFALLFLAWPTLTAYFSPRPWATALAVVAVVLFLIGGIAFLTTVSRIRREEERRALKTKEDWQRLTPAGFEQHVADLFKARGYQAKVCGGTADGGIDIEVSHNSIRGIVQCKRYSKHVGVKAIREFSAVASRANAGEAFFVTSSGFTRDALNWAKREPIHLVDGDELIDWTKDLQFGAYAKPMPRPPLFFSATQWLILTMLGIGVIGVLGLLFGMVMGL
jgi:restriction system protein